MSLKNNDRFAELDALRGVAAIAVLIHHFLYVYSNRFGYESFSFQDVDISNPEINLIGIFFLDI